MQADGLEIDSTLAAAALQPQSDIPSFTPLRPACVTFFRSSPSRTRKSAPAKRNETPPLLNRQ